MQIAVASYHLTNGGCNLSKVLEKMTEKTTKTVLLVDDDDHIIEVVGYALKKNGLRVIEASQGQQAISRFREEQIDLVILDIGMPPDVHMPISEDAGFEVCKEIRKTSSVPIIMLTVFDSEVDEVSGFKLGADDYVTKPFRPRVLMERVNAQLRRAERDTDQASSEQIVSSGLLTHGDLRVDLDRWEVYCGEIEIELTATQFGIVKTLASRPEKVFTRSEIMDRAYKHENHVVLEHNIDGHVKDIRKRFRNQGCENPIKTVHGVGFRLNKLNAGKKP